MAPRTGRKYAATDKTKAKALDIKAANPELSCSEIAARLGVTGRQVNYWLQQANKKAKSQ